MQCSALPTQHRTVLSCLPNIALSCRPNTALSCSVYPTLLCHVLSCPFLSFPVYPTMFCLVLSIQRCSVLSRLPHCAGLRPNTALSCPVNQHHPGRRVYLTMFWPIISIQYCCDLSCLPKTALSCPVYSILCFPVYPTLLCHALSTHISLSCQVYPTLLCSVLSTQTLLRPVLSSQHCYDLSYLPNNVVAYLYHIYPILLCSVISCLPNAVLSCLPSTALSCPVYPSLHCPVMHTQRCAVLTYLPNTVHNLFQSCDKYHVMEALLQTEDRSFQRICRWHEEYAHRNGQDLETLRHR